MLLNNSSAKKLAVKVAPKTIYPKELPSLKWWLLGRSLALKK